MPMDTNPGSFYSSILLSFGLIPLDLPPIDTAAVVSKGASRASSVCLPYSSIPGLDTSSTAYYQFLSLLSKQPSVKPSPGPIPGSHEMEVCNVCSPHDLVTIKRTREIVTDPTISALVKEDNQAHIAFHDGIRHEIVVNCERLRVHLSLIDRLMSIYSLSIANAKAKGKVPF